MAYTKSKSCLMLPLSIFNFVCDEGVEVDVKVALPSEKISLSREELDTLPLRLEELFGERRMLSHACCVGP